MKIIKCTFFVLAALFFGYFFIGQSFLPHNELDTRNVCTEYNGTWTFTDDTGITTTIEVPCNTKADLEYIETVIPSDLDEDVTTLCFRGRELQAYLDGQLIYDYNTSDSRWFGKISPEASIMLPISASDAGKTLRICLSPRNNILYESYVGTELGIWGYLLRIYSGELIVAVITFILGLLTIMISIIYASINKKILDIFYLGIGVSLAAIWIVANSVFRQFVFPNVSIASDLPFLMVMLLPFPFIIYMNEIQEHRYLTLYRIICFIMAALNIISITLYVLSIKDLVETFIYVALGALLVILSLIFTFVLDVCNGKIKKYKFVAFGLLGTFITSIIQLITYFTRTGIFKASFLAIGLLFLLFGASMHSIHSIFSIAKDKTAAEIANAAKGKFLAHMSHEIRTPINAVLGMNEMILRESNEPSTRDYALDIQSAGKSLLSLVNDILDLSKIDSGKLEIIPVDYDVCSMIHDTVNMVSHKAKTKNLQVWLNVDNTIPSRLKGDDIRIRQILINILNNAVKYTNEGGVTFSVSCEQKDNIAILHFSIKDTGIGIKEEDLPKLTEEFQRIEESRNRNIEGTGLGMSITVRLLSLMNSHLNVSSEYGKGSCFYFDLTQEIVSDIPIGNLSERIKNQENEYVYHKSFVAPDADILVVDDNAINRKVLRSLLKETLVRIDETDSGEECLEKTMEKKYDLIFLDHMMPGMDGIETLKELHKQENNPNLHTPVIALTANAVTGAKEMYLANGFDAFLSKPIIYEKLENIIIEFLSKEKLTINGAPSEEIKDIPDKITDDSTGVQSILDKLPEINLEYAYLHNSSPQDLYNIIVDFIKMIDTDADKLEKYAQNLTMSDNLKQYRVKVHAMKASAAMIGAIHLSGMARMLEIYAINEDISAIVSVTPLFLREWRGFKEKLKPVSDRENANVENIETIDVNTDILLEQFGFLAKAMEDMDVDKADEIVSILKQFSYPSDYSAYMLELYNAVESLDDARILEIISIVKQIILKGDKQ